MTELREFAQRSGDFEKLGVRVVPISVDDEQHAPEVWEKAGKRKLTILTDPGATVIKKYGLLHEGGHDGADIALRTTLLVGPDGRERWRRVSRSVPDIPTADETLAKIKETQERQEWHGSEPLMQMKPKATSSRSTKNSGVRQER